MNLFGGRYSLKKYRLCGRKSKPQNDFTLTSFLLARYLEPFCPEDGRDSTPAGLLDAEFTSD
jgi:hypothetical protein